MVMHRIVPNLKVADAQAGDEFHVEFLGMEKAFDLGWAASSRSPDNWATKVSLVSGDATAAEDSVISVDVGDVDAPYTRGPTPRLRDRPPADRRRLRGAAVVRPRPPRQRHQHGRTPD
jgi:hypothetical protein